MLKIDFAQAWWCIPIIPSLRKLRQKDHKFETNIALNIGYIMRTSLKKKREKKIWL
jgi:hypothetical protein